MAVRTEHRFLLDYVVVKDVRPQSTDAGTFNAGGWVVRPLNSIVISRPGLASLASNRLTLSPGIWEVFVHGGGYQIGRHQLRLFNLTAGTSILGTSERANASDLQTNRSFIADIFEIASTSLFEIQHRCSDSRSGDGLGDSAQFAQEVYTVGLFKRLRA